MQVNITFWNGSSFFLISDVFAINFFGEGVCTFLLQIILNYNVNKKENLERKTKWMNNLLYLH